MTTMNVRILVLACAAALTGLTLGCSLAPDYRQPELPVSNGYPADAPLAPAPAKPEARKAADIAWRDYFTDPQLQTVIEQALKNTTAISASRSLRVLEARAAFQVRRADQFPHPRRERGAFAWERFPDSLSPHGEFDASPAIYDVGASVAAWEIDFWGRVSNLKGAALEQFLATDAGRRAVTVSLVAQVANGYLSLRELDERIVIARETIRTREESFRIFTRRFQVGTTTRLDVAQVETLLTQAQALGAQLEQARAAQAHALTLLVGTQPARLSERSNLNDARSCPTCPSGLPSDLLQQRPDIVAAEHRLRSATREHRRRARGILPDITLTGFFGSASAELERPVRGGTAAGYSCRRSSLPIFDGGRRQANLDVGEGAPRRGGGRVRAHDTGRVPRRRRRAVRAALAQRADHDPAACGRGPDGARPAREAALDRGLATFLELLDAQRDLLAAEQQLVQQRRALLFSRVALYAALGGGSQHYGEPPAPTARYERRRRPDDATRPMTKGEHPWPTR